MQGSDLALFGYLGGLVLGSAPTPRMRASIRRRLLVLVMIGAMTVADGYGSSRGSGSLPSSISTSAELQDAGDVIEMQGALNTRDVGGFPIADGRIIKSGILYRSSALTYLTDKDRATLSALTIDRVIDFRGPREQAEGPDRLPSRIATISAPITQDELDFTKIDALLDQQRFSPQMHDREKVGKFGPFYRMFNLVNSYGDPGFLPKLAAYKAIFDQLLDPSRAGTVLMHCTGGRDRTGIGTAILLRALGVSEKTIEANYLASNILLQPDRARSRQHLV